MKCLKTFSTATLVPTYRQHKRRVNSRIWWLLSMKVSQRALARYLRINRKTVARKLDFLGARAEAYLANLPDREIPAIHFDELQSSVHSKCKPVAIPLAVDSATRRILGLDVASMPAQPPLDQIALARYGPRPDDRPLAIDRVLSTVKHMVKRDATITTDMALYYPAPIAKHFPEAAHSAFRSRKSRSDGQGELKRIGYDPLFSLNHTAAMIRDGVTRMVRRTWCTSKRIDRLRAHLLIYAQFHNEVRLRCPE